MRSILYSTTTIVNQVSHKCDCARSCKAPLQSVSIADVCPRASIMCKKGDHAPQL